jgi:hypothetical protein
MSMNSPYTFDQNYIHHNRSITETNSTGLLSSLYALFPNTVVNKLSTFHLSLKGSPFIKNCTQQLVDKCNITQALELLIASLKALELQDSTLSYLAYNDKQYISDYNCTQLYQEQSFNNELPLNDNSFLLLHNSVEDHQNDIAYDQPKESTAPQGRSNIKSTLFQMDNPKPAKGKGSYGSHSSYDKPTVNGKQRSAILNKNIKESNSSDNLNTNLRMIFSKTVEVRAIKKCISKGMKDEHLDLLKHYIINPEKNLVVIKNLVIDGYWDLFEPDEPDLLLYKSGNVGLFICFRVLSKDWVFITKIIKN